MDKEVLRVDRRVLRVDKRVLRMEKMSNTSRKRILRVTRQEKRNAINITFDY